MTLCQTEKFVECSAGGIVINLCQRLSDMLTNLFLIAVYMVTKKNYISSFKPL